MRVIAGIFVCVALAAPIAGGRVAAEQSALSKRDAAAIEKAFNEALNSGRLPEMGKLIRGAAEEQKVWMFETLTRHIESHPDAEIRMICIGAMGNFPEKGLDIVTRSLRADLDREVRSIAAYVLSSIGTEQETGALFEAIKEDKGVFGEGRDIAETAIGALGAIGGDRAAEILSEIWKSEELSRSCREATLNALGAAGDPCAVAVLEQVLRGKREWLRDNAVYGLSQLADRRRGQVEVVKKVAGLLREHVGDRNPRLRTNAVRGLGTAGVAEDIMLLEGLLQDDYSTEVLYTEEGELKTKTTYPIREAAKDAIRRIKKRMPLQETVLPGGSSAEEETPGISGASATSQEFRRDFLRIKAQDWVLDLKASAKLAGELEKKWFTKDKEHYGYMMLQICGTFSSLNFEDDRRFALAREYAILALEKSYTLEGNDKIPIEVELRLLMHILQGGQASPEYLRGLAKSEDWPNKREKTTTLYFRGWERLVKAIDKKWDPNDPSLLPPGPHTGMKIVAGGMSPENIKDPNLREEYEAALEEYRHKCKLHSEQRTLRRLKKEDLPRLQKYLLRLWSGPSFDSKELETEALQRALEKHIKDKEVRAIILDGLRKKLIDESKPKPKRELGARGRRSSR